MTKGKSEIQAPGNHPSAVFSHSAQEYLKYRPTYPDELFGYLSSLTKNLDCAWDCATGSGQAALGLANYFKKVIATDIVAEQIQVAPKHPKIDYRIVSAEASELASQTANLITVAQAIHWFSLEDFYREVRRVVKPSGILAVWCYKLPKIDSKIDESMLSFYNFVNDSSWDKKGQLVEDEYKSLPFPFAEITAPRFECKTIWNYEQWLGFMRSWSPSRKANLRLGYDPTLKLESQFRRVFPENEAREVHWDLHLRVGRI